MNKPATLVALAFLVLAYEPGLIQAQPSASDFKNQFNQHFDNASRVLALAREMPANTYSWRPMEGASSVEELFTHIAHYNFYYPENSLDIPAPGNIEVKKIESITGKNEVIEVLERSIEHVKEAVEAMPENKLNEPTELYGRKVNGQAVLLQLLTHMSEHVGQSIAYARMNKIVPPWNR